MKRDEQLIGKRVQITDSTNPYARSHVGKFGTVQSTVGNGMVSVALDDGTRDYWALPHNLKEQTQYCSVCAAGIREAIECEEPDCGWIQR